jgi:cell division protein FtsX
MDLITLITAISTFILGGGLVAIISVKSARRKAEAEAEVATVGISKAREEVTGDNIKNAADLIDLYKKGIEDIRTLHETQIQAYIEKLEDLKKSFDEYKLNTSQRIKELEEENRSLRNKYDQVLLKLSSDCSTCECVNSCLKYKNLHGK